MSKDSRLNVSVFVDEPHAFLQAVEAALTAAEHSLGNATIHLVSFSLHVGNEGPNHLDYCNDQCSKCRCP